MIRKNKAHNFTFRLRPDIGMMLIQLSKELALDRSALLRRLIRLAYQEMVSSKLSANKKRTKNE